MNRKTVKIIAIVIAAIFLLTLMASLIGMFVYGEPQERELTLDNLHQYEMDLNELSHTVYDLQEKLSDPDAQIEKLNQQIGAAQEQADAMSEKFGKRFAVACERGSSSSLELLLSARNVSDYMDNTVIAQEIAAYDSAAVSELENAKEAVERSKAELEEFVENIDSNRERLKEADSALASKKRETSDFLAALEESGRYDKVMQEKTEALLALTREVGGSIKTVDTPKTVNDLELVLPSDSEKIIRGYSEETHAGYDIGMKFGSGIYAAADGTVAFAGENKGYGNCIILDHGGVLTLYGHLSALGVEQGQSVEAGYQIGIVGSTGSPAGPYLHFELIEDGKPLDPRVLFRSETE